MTLKTYQAPSMAEALAQIKRDLGQDAVILQTRIFRKDKLLGLIGGRRTWEVTATGGLHVPRRIAEGRYVGGGLEPFDEQTADAGNHVPVQRLGEHLTEIRRMVESLVKSQGRGKQDEDSPAALREVRRQLAAQDVTDAMAADLTAQLGLRLSRHELEDAPALRKKLLPLVASRIPVVGRGAAPRGAGARVVALIGPTGVGKTTTIAKLAANYKLREGKRVGLITVDSYRIAAVDQLRTYAEIIDVPLRAVLTPGELNQAVRAMKELDVLLVDTAGRGQNDRPRLDQLGAFVRAAEADEVHLVLCATANRRCLAGVLDRFGPLGANRLIVTKLDEAEAFGIFLNLSPVGMPISYVTTGQDVPDDIESADPLRLAEKIVGGGTDAS